jgi:hypothetical protein
MTPLEIPDERINPYTQGYLVGVSPLFFKSKLFGETTLREGQWAHLEFEDGKREAFPLYVKISDLESMIGGEVLLANTHSFTGVLCRYTFSKGNVGRYTSAMIVEPEHEWLKLATPKAPESNVARAAVSMKSL